MMQNPRIFLLVALAIVLWLNYQAWVRDYSPAAGVTASQTALAPVKRRDLATELPQAAAESGGKPAPAAVPGVPAASAADSGAGIVHVRTDVLDLDIDRKGGTLRRADLPRYPQVKGGSVPVRLMNADPDTLYLLQTGLTGAGDSPHPTHLALFESDRADYTLGDAGELRVPLHWTDGNGVEVTKTYLFHRGSYRIDVEYDVVNHSAGTWAGAPYAQILRNDPPTKSSMFDVQSRAFHGPALWDGAKYRKLNIADKDDSALKLDVTHGWVAALQHHFVAAIVPPADAAYHYTLGVEGTQYLLTVRGPSRPVEAGATGHFEQNLFVGPKLQAQLESLHPELERVADFGHLYFLAKPLFWLLQHIYNGLHNWGLAIIIVTFLLKLAFYPLSETSGRSMAKMKLLSPRIKNLQETYKDDREKLGRAMMDLYKREKVNPVAGCLPVIIQIPVFLAFYWVLLESVEMRQAPFMGWINDLSSRDPFFILPAIMAAAMFVQYKLNPQVGDPVQQKVMMIMPLAMSVMFAFFPAGLVLYWVTNTLLSIAQQWNINRRIEAAKKN